MTRPSVFATAAMALTLIAGCDRAADEQRRATQAQAEADKQIAEANKEATTRTTGAQVEADKKIAAAESDFGKRREDYRHKVQNDLIDVDKKIDVLEAKAKKATGKDKADLDAKLAQIHTRRSAFGADVASLETVTAPQWDDTKARVDKNWDDLKDLVSSAKP